MNWGRDNLVIFSSDPTLPLMQPLSAEQEMKNVKVRLREKAVVFQRGTLFSTGILFDTNQEVQIRFAYIQNVMKRPAALAATLESFCEAPGVSVK